jgi:cell wall-associated NlpC family hydrolase
VPLADRKPGDWIYYKFPGVSHDACDHVGLYIGENKTIEGNTSPGLQGSQNNGGVVALKEFGVNRSLTQVVACVRPTYHR